MKYVIMRRVSPITLCALPGKKMSRGRVGSLEEKPVRGLLCAGQEGCCHRMDVCPEGTRISPSRWWELPVRDTCPWRVIFVPFTRGKGLCSPVKQRPPGWTGIFEQPWCCPHSRGVAAGWVRGLEQQLQNLLAWGVCSKQCAGSCASALTTHSEPELVFVRAWGKPLLDLGWDAVWYSFLVIWAFCLSQVWAHGVFSGILRTNAL